MPRGVSVIAWYRSLMSFFSHPFVDARCPFEEVFLLVGAADVAAVVADKLLDGIDAPAACGGNTRENNDGTKPRPGGKKGVCCSRGGLVKEYRHHSGLRFIFRFVTNE